jgi:hypothetical protein
VQAAAAGQQAQAFHLLKRNWAAMVVSELL